MIYGHPPLTEIIRTATGLSSEELFLFGMALLGNFMQTFALFYPPNIQIPGLSSDGLDRFLSHFSRSLSDLKGLLQGEHQMNDRFAYAYHSLRAYPLIKRDIKGEIVWFAPFRRFSSGDSRTASTARFSTSQDLKMRSETHFSGMWGK